MEPLLSIVIPLYNKQDHIINTLQSILTQSFIDYEIIVVDDGSTDDGAIIVESLSDNRIHLYRKGNGGPSSARNYGSKKAKGKWILFLDADDTLEESSLQQIALDIKKHKYADVFCYNYYMITNQNKRLCISNHIKGYLLFPFYDLCLNRVFPCTGNMICKRNVILKELYREDLHRYEDAERIFRLMNNYRFYASPAPIFSYNRDSSSASLPRKNIKEDYICQMEPCGKSFFEQIAMYKLYQEACNLYSKDIESIYGDTFEKKRYKIITKLIYYYLQLKRKLSIG